MQHWSSRPDHRRISLISSQPEKCSCGERWLKNLRKMQHCALVLQITDESSLSLSRKSKTLSYQLAGSFEAVQKINPFSNGAKTESCRSPSYHTPSPPSLSTPTHHFVLALKSSIFHLHQLSLPNLKPPLSVLTMSLSLATEIIVAYDEIVRQSITHQ